MLQEYADNVESYISSYAEQYIETGRTKLVVIDTTASSEETVGNLLKDSMAPKVILINHEKRLPVDAIAANLGIKYNFMYLSVYQLIKQHIEQGTAFGKLLIAAKKTKNLNLGAALDGQKDEFAEEDYSAAHFDLDLVVELVCNTIAQQRRPYQTFILLEGLCNSARLTSEEDRLELRYMDELFMIEKHIGEVQAVVGLQFETEREYIEETEIEYEVFPDPEPVAVVKKIVNEDGEEVDADQAEPANEGGEGEEGEDKKKPAFRIEDKKWTITDRKPKNLPQLFMQSKGIGARHEIRQATATGIEGSPTNSAINTSSLHEAVTRSLDEFCAKFLELRNGTEKYLYQQIIFNLEQ